MDAALLAAIQKISEAAVACERSSACPGEMLAAQCILESGYLKYAPGNNCFGIKSATASGQLLRTSEWMTPVERDAFLKAKAGRTAVLDPAHIAPRNGRDKYIVEDWFATFASLADCFKKRAEMFAKSPYTLAAGAFAADRDFPKLVRAIAMFYATSPDYADQVLKIASMQAVRDALAKARSVT